MNNEGKLLNLTMKNDYGKTIKLDIYKTYFAKDKIATLEKIKK